MSFLRGIKKAIQKIRTTFWTIVCMKKIKEKGKNCQCNYKCHFSKSMILGDNCNFNGFFVEGSGKVTIGNNFHSGKNILAITQNHNYKGSRLPYDETYVVRDITIGNQVWLGSNVILLGGVTIGDGAIIQAGSVVCADIPELAIAGGHPATPFMYRDKAHYNELNTNKQYL